MSYWKYFKLNGLRNCLKFPNKKYKNLILCLEMFSIQFIDNLLFKPISELLSKLQFYPINLTMRSESGSTARNASARISTEKCQLLDKKKYAVHVPRVNFEQLIKKVQLLEISSR
jgi:hypothetical protein